MTIYIRLKNAEENEKLYRYLVQNNYKYLTAVDTKNKTYLASWESADMLATISKDYKVVTLQQFILKQEGRILL